MRPRLLLWSLSAAALLAVAVFGFTSLGSPKTGRLAPALPAEHLSGPPLAFSSAPSSAAVAGASAGPRAGAGAGVGAGSVSRDPRGPVAVVFWASWCGPCVREAPAVERFSKSPSGRGRVVGVDWSDSLSGARSFLRRFSWSFPNQRDSSGASGLAYGLAGLPTTYVIDSSGRVRATLHGPQDERTLGSALSRVG